MPLPWVGGSGSKKIFFFFLRYVVALHFLLPKWAQPALNSRRSDFYGISKLGYISQNIVKYTGKSHKSGSQKKLLNLIQAHHFVQFSWKWPWNCSLMIWRQNRSHFFEILLFWRFWVPFRAEKGGYFWHFRAFWALKGTQNLKKSKISKKWLLFFLHIIKLQFHGHFHENWTKWRAFFWDPDLWDFPVYFTIFCEMYPNFEMP